jgi:pimeloyl-ACP methyl ester carboxylesterase
MSNPLYRSPAGEQEVMAFYNSVLERWPVPHDELNISTRWGNTFVIESGDPARPPLVLLHGANSNALSWIGDVPGYCSDFRVYAIDIPGDPGRSAPSRLDLNSPAYAEWLEDVLNELHIEKTHLLGLSQGGLNAIRFATCYPDRVERLVLLSPGGVIAEKASFLIKAIFFSFMGKRGAEAINRLTFGKQPIDPTAVKYMNLIMTHFRARISKVNNFTDEDLRKLTMPVLLIGGQQDAIRDVEKIAQRLARSLPALTVKMYPEMGHVLVNLNKDILPFLKSERTASAVAA